MESTTVLQQDATLSNVPLFFYPYIGGEPVLLLNKRTGVMEENPGLTIYNRHYVYKDPGQDILKYYTVYRGQAAPKDLMQSDFLTDAQRYPTQETMTAWSLQLSSIMEQVDVPICTAECLLQYFRSVPLAVEMFLRVNRRAAAEKAARAASSVSTGLQAVKVPLYFNPRVGAFPMWVRDEAGVQRPDPKMNGQNFLYTFTEDKLGGVRFYYNISKNIHLPRMLTDEQRYPSAHTLMIWEKQIQSLMEATGISKEDAEIYMNFRRTTPKN